MSDQKDGGFLDHLSSYLSGHDQKDDQKDEFLERWSRKMIQKDNLVPMPLWHLQLESYLSGLAHLSGIAQKDIFLGVERWF